MKKIIFALILISNFLFAQQTNPVATVFKPIGKVEHKKINSINWTNVKSGTPLFTNDKIKTSERSFVIVKFLEGSAVRIQEKSEVTIHGNLDKNNAMQKGIDIRTGTIGFNVQRRPNEKFEFSTPTSVASIKGTSGILETGENSDKLIVLSGSVELSNKITNQTLSVGAGQTGISDSSGKLNSMPASSQELNRANSIAPTSGTGSIPGTDTTKSTSSTQPTNPQSTTSAFTLNFSIEAPPATENKDVDVSITIQSSVAIDSVKKIIKNILLYYKGAYQNSFKSVPVQFEGNNLKIRLPADTSFSPPAIYVYLKVTRVNGEVLTFPPDSPESNPISIPIQAGKRNELKIEFIDPTGKRKTMVIEY